MLRRIQSVFAKNVMHVIASNLINKTSWKQTLLSPYYRWESWNSKWLSNLPKVTARKKWSWDSRSCFSHSKSWILTALYGSPDSKGLYSEPRQASKAANVGQRLPALNEGSSGYHDFQQQSRDWKPCVELPLTWGLCKVQTLGKQVREKSPRLPIRDLHTVSLVIVECNSQADSRLKPTMGEGGEPRIELSLDPFGLGSISHSV